MKTYVDVPFIAARGTSVERNVSLTMVLLTWLALGVELAWKKAQRGLEATWTSASIKISKHMVTAAVKAELFEVPQGSDPLHARRYLCTRAFGSTGALEVSPFASLQVEERVPLTVSGDRPFEPLKDDPVDPAGVRADGKKTPTPRQHIRCAGCDSMGPTNHCVKCKDMYCERCVNPSGVCFMCAGAYPDAPERLFLLAASSIASAGQDIEALSPELSAVIA